MKLPTKIILVSAIPAAFAALGDRDGRILVSKSSKNSKKSGNNNVNIRCGDFVRNDVVLLEDLVCDCQRGPDSTFSAITVVGPAILDLNGRTVSCTDGSWEPTETDLSSIIRVEGRAGGVTNGVVSTGNFGIVLGGSGHHFIGEVSVQKTANDGVQVNAPFCEVTSSVFSDNGLGFYSVERLMAECDDLVDCEFVEKECPEAFDPTNPDAVPCFNGDVSGDGIDLGEDSQYSVVSDNTIVNYGDDGISCRGSFNVIRGNSVFLDELLSPRTSKSEDAIIIRGIGNQVVGNNVARSTKDGIDIKFNEDDDEENCGNEFTGGFNVIRSNSIIEPSKGKGIKIGSNGNFVVLNSVENAQDDPGFQISKGDCDVGGNGNYLADNVSSNNVKAGYDIKEANNNVLVRNVATENQKEGFVIAMEMRGLANIVAGNTAAGNSPDFREKGDGIDDGCTLNAFIGNVASGDNDADPTCLLGDQIDLSLVL